MIDAHIHLVDDLSRGYGWLDGPEQRAIRRTYSTDDLRAASVGTGVSAALLVEPGLVGPELTLESLEQTRTDPMIAGVIGWVKIDHEGVSEQLAAYRAAPGGSTLVGVRDHVQRFGDKDFMARPDVLHGLAAVADAGLVYDLIARSDQLPGALVAIRAWPELRFAITHLGNPPYRGSEAAWRRWRTSLIGCAEYPNVAVKVSGVHGPTHRQQEALELVSAHFGPDRMLPASNWPLCLLHNEYPDAWQSAATVADPASPAAFYRLER